MSPDPTTTAVSPEPSPAVELNRLTGEFVQSAAESEFLEDYTLHSLRAYDVVALIIAAIFLSFSVLDFMSLGNGPAFTALALGRIAGAASILLARHLMLQDPYRMLVAQRGAVIAVTEAVVFVVALCAVALRPPDASTGAISVAVVIVAATAMLPLPFWPQIAISFCTLSGLLVLALTALRGHFAVAPLVANLAVTIAWAVFIRRTVNLDARRRWLATTRAELVSARLEAELETAGRLREELQILATQDPLTGVSNRRELLRRAESLVGDRRGDGISMLLLDADAFKSINDRFGHATGDAALITLASTIRSSVRPTDLVARIGGEEFAVLFNGLSRTAAAETAERIRRNVEATVVPGPDHVRLSVSVGLVEASGGDTVEGLLSRADAAMYRAKRDGGNRVAFDLPPGQIAEAQSPEMLFEATDGSLVEHITT